MSDHIDPSELRESTKESVAKIRDMTDDLRAVIEHEDRVVGDLIKQQALHDKELSEAESKP